MESDAERGVGSSEYGGEELPLPLTIAKLNRGMDSIVAKAGTLPTLKNVAGITSFERKFKSALEATPFGCYPSMLLDVYEGKVGWSEAIAIANRVMEGVCRLRTASPAPRPAAPASPPKGRGRMRQ